MARSDKVKGFAAGGAFFIAASWLLHCKLGLGPWKCQSTDPRHQANAVGECGQQHKLPPSRTGY